MQAGTYQWQARYSGDANNNATVSPAGSEPVVVNSGNLGGGGGIVMPNISKIDLLGSNFGSDPNRSMMANIIFVNSLYHSVLNRVPDIVGLDSWMQMLEAGVPRFQVVQAIWRSAEHRGLEVDQLYREFLHRDADPVGRAGWVNALLGGESETDVSVAFATSGEYLASHPGAASYVQGLYHDILGRVADAGGEVGFEAALANGVSTAAIARAFLTSTEHDLRLLDAYYVAFLGRHPDPAGQMAWLGQLESGLASPETVAELILASGEYFASPH
jgi:hypothetical protein